MDINTWIAVVALILVAYLIAEALIRGRIAGLARNCGVTGDQVSQLHTLMTGFPDRAKLVDPDTGTALLIHHHHGMGSVDGTITVLSRANFQVTEDIIDGHAHIYFPARGRWQVVLTHHEHYRVHASGDDMDAPPGRFRLLLIELRRVNRIFWTGQHLAQHGEVADLIAMLRRARLLQI